MRLRALTIVCLALALAGCDDPEGTSGDANSAATTSPEDASGADTQAPDATTIPSTDASASTDDTAASASDLTDPGDSPLDTAGDATPDVPLVELRPAFVGVGNWGLRGFTTDGTTWTDVQNAVQANDHTPDLLRNVAWGDGHFVVVGGDQNSMIMRSADGLAWEEDLHPDGGQWLGAVAWGDGVWVAAGGVGTHMRSTDGGVTWTPGSPNIGGAIRDMVWGEGRFVAVGDGGTIAVSTDGATWTETTEGSLGFSNVGYGAGTFVATASNWNGGGFDTHCVSSADAETWSACPFTSGRLGGATGAEGSLWVALEDGWAVTADGSAWTTVQGEFPDDVVWMDGRWVGTSHQRRWTATSAESWSNVQNEAGFRAIAAGLVE